MAKRKGSAGKAAPAKQAVKEAPSAPQVFDQAAAPESKPKATGGTISRKEQMRAVAVQKRKQQNMMVAGAGVVILLLVAVTVFINIRNSQPVVGETTYPTQGNLHIPLGSTSSLTYNSTPPTSGPHYENLAAWGIQTQNARYEHLIHNLEDRGVVIYYQCEDGCPEIVAELEAIVEPYLADGRHIVLTRNDPTWVVGTSQPLHKDMGAPIALAAWRKLLLMDEVNADTIRTFIERYEGIDHHRG
ncbi:MAG: DUF3105 domain-containing protein [Caldilineaceae bacterium]|nr:DUF3105 domain-containing protein [Caldilineaceae bacterium]